MAHHSFDTEIADDYSVPEAILVQYFDFNLTKNKAHDRHFHDGRYWTRATVKGLHDIYSYFTDRQLYNTLLNLRGETDKAKKQEGKYPVVLAVPDYNQKTDDKSLWYTFTDAFLERHGCRLDVCRVGKHTEEEPEEVQEVTETSLLQFCKRLFEECQNIEVPTHETLLQFCKWVLSLKPEDMTPDIETLIQNCKRANYKIGSGLLQFCKCIKGYIIAVNSNKDSVESLKKENKKKETAPSASAKKTPGKKAVSKKSKKRTRTEPEPGEKPYGEYQKVWLTDEAYASALKYFKGNEDELLFWIEKVDLYIENHPDKDLGGKDSYLNHGAVLRTFKNNRPGEYQRYLADASLQPYQQQAAPKKSRFQTNDERNYEIIRRSQERAARMEGRL